MKNKKLKLGVLVMAAVTVFTATAYAAGTTNEGYDALKQIMKDSETTERMSSASLSWNLRLSDNDTIIAEVTGVLKEECDAKEASGNVKFNIQGKKQDLSFFHTGEEAYITDDVNDKYYKVVNLKQESERNNSKYNNEEYSTHTMGTAEENILDYLMGDLKSQFELSKNNNGTKSIIMDLDQNEIPVALNLLIAAAGLGHENAEYDRLDADNAHEQMLVEKFPFMKGFCDINEDTLPALSQNVKLSALVFKLNVDADNQIKSVEVKVNITGNDEQGGAHDILFQSSFAISEINKTNADEFDQIGKKIDIIDADDFKCGRD